MKQLLLLSTIVISGFAAHAQTDSIRGNQYSLKGKIIAAVQLTPHCGFIAWGTVVTFEITSFTDNTYKDSRIGVIFTCPEFYKTGFFETGKMYELVIADQNQADFSWVIPNENDLSKYKLAYKPWVVKAKKIN